jgi:hypothetical protein
MLLGSEVWKRGSASAIHPSGEEDKPAHLSIAGSFFIAITIFVRWDKGKRDGLSTSVGQADNGRSHHGVG